MKRLLAVLTLCVMVTACRSERIVATDIHGVSYSPGIRAFTLTNWTEENAYYFIVGKNTSALIDWAPCVNEGCPFVPPNGSVTRTHAEVGIDATETTAILYWWHAVTINGVRAPGRVRSSEVSLRCQPLCVPSQSQLERP